MSGGLDVILALLAAAGPLLGSLRGFVGVFLDLVALVGGAVLAAFAYRGPVRLFNYFNISGIAVDVVFYTLTSVLLTTILVIVFEALRRRRDTRHVVDRFFGFFLGFVEAAVFASGILVLLSTAAGPASEVQKSRIASRLAPLVCRAYDRADRAGIPVPRPVTLTASYREEFGSPRVSLGFSGIRYSSLEGSTCLRCGGKVRFEGYRCRWGMAVAPKFVCTECGRTSDGCQTYEGYHLLYGKCPVELARKGAGFDCGNFPNRTWIVPQGKCPRDGDLLESWKRHGPVPWKSSTEGYYRPAGASQE